MTNQEIECQSCRTKAKVKHVTRLYTTPPHGSGANDCQTPSAIQYKLLCGNCGERYQTQSLSSNMKCSLPGM